MGDNGGYTTIDNTLQMKLTKLTFASISGVDHRNEITCATSAAFSNSNSIRILCQSEIPALCEICEQTKRQPSLATTMTGLEKQS